MANWQQVLVDTDLMEAGKFYIIEVDKDLAPNLRLTTSFTEPISKIPNIENDISTLETINSNLNDRITDNTNRVNILEDRSLEKELQNALDLLSIKIPLINQTRLEIEHNRKEIYNIKVIKEEYENFKIKRVKNISAGTTIFEEKSQDPTDTNKKLILDFGDVPISGYVLII